MQPNYSSGKDKARYPWNGRSVCSRLQLQPDTQFHSNKHEIDSKGSNTVRGASGSARPRDKVHEWDDQCAFFCWFSHSKKSARSREWDKEREKELVGIMCFSQESAIRVCALGLMAKTVRGVVRLGGPLSPDTLPSNAFIITAGGKKALKVTRKKKKKFASFLLYAHVAYWALCSNAKTMHKNTPTVAKFNKQWCKHHKMTAEANSGQNLAREHAKFPAKGVSRTSAERANCHRRRRCHHNGLSVAVLSSTVPIHVLCALTLPLPLFLVQTHRQLCLTRGFLDANREGQTETACPAYALITQACSPLQLTSNKYGWWKRCLFRDKMHMTVQMQSCYLHFLLSKHLIIRGNRVTCRIRWEGLYLLGLRPRWKQLVWLTPVSTNTCTVQAPPILTKLLLV